jgi:hypothetical protein
MQNVEEKTVDVDTSGPGAEVQLPEAEKPENEKYKQKRYLMKQLMKTILSPMTQLRNLLSSLMFKQKKTRNKNQKKK